MEEQLLSDDLMGRNERRLRGLMAEAGFRSVSHLAEVLGQKYPGVAVNRASLSRLLHGKRPRPSIHLMRAVSRELGVTLDDLYELLVPSPGSDERPSREEALDDRQPGASSNPGP